MTLNTNVGRALLSEASMLLDVETKGVGVNLMTSSTRSSDPSQGSYQSKTLLRNTHNPKHFWPSGCQIFQQSEWNRPDSDFWQLLAHVTGEIWFRVTATVAQGPSYSRTDAAWAWISQQQNVWRFLYHRDDQVMCGVSPGPLLDVEATLSLTLSWFPNILVFMRIPEQRSLCDRHTTSSIFSSETKPPFTVHSYQTEIEGFLMRVRNIYVTVAHPRASRQHSFPLCNSWPSIFVPAAPVTSETSSPADYLCWKVYALQLFSHSVFLWVHLALEVNPIAS